MSRSASISSSFLVRTNVRARPRGHPRDSHSQISAGHEGLLEAGEIARFVVQSFAGHVIAVRLCRIVGVLQSIQSATSSERARGSDQYDMVGKRLENKTSDSDVNLKKTFRASADM